MLQFSKGSMRTGLEYKLPTLVWSLRELSSRVYAAPFTRIFLPASIQSHFTLPLGTMIMDTFQMRKLRLRQGKKCAQSPTARNWWSWERNLDLCVLILGSCFKVIRYLGIGRGWLAREKGPEPTANTLAHDWGDQGRRTDHQDGCSVFGP